MTQLKSGDKTSSTVDLKTDALNEEGKGLPFDLSGRFSKLNLHHEYLCQPEIPTMVSIGIKRQLHEIVQRFNSYF